MEKSRPLRNATGAPGGIAAEMSTPAQAYVSLPAGDLLAFAQRHRPDGYLSVSLFAHVYFGRSPFTGQIEAHAATALFVASPRVVDDEPIFAYLCLACPPIAQAAAPLLHRKMCSPATTWVKISHVHGMPPLAVPFASELKLACHAIDPALLYAGPRGAVSRSVEYAVLCDPDLWAFADEVL